MVNLKTKYVPFLLSPSDHYSVQIVKTNGSKIDLILQYKKYLVKSKMLMHPLD